MIKNRRHAAETLGSKKLFVVEFIVSTFENSMSFFGYSAQLVVDRHKFSRLFSGLSDAKERHGLNKKHDLRQSESFAEKSFKIFNLCILANTFQQVTSKTNRSMKKLYAFFFSVCLTAFLPGLSFAQLNYVAGNCQNLTGTYNDLGTNGTAITFSNLDNANSAATPIGFSFNYNGSNFTQVRINTNGFIKLGTLAPSIDSLYFAGGASYTGGIFNSTDINDANIIAPFNHDLIGGTGAEIRTYTSGTAPNRAYTIQYKNMRDKTISPAVQFDAINFQIILYESSNIIEFVYGSFVASTNLSSFKSAACGIKGDIGTTANELITVTKGSTTVWSGATFAGGNYTGNAFNFRNSILPDAGRTLRFVPTFANDLAVTLVYTLGRMALPYGNPHAVQARITNSGTNAFTGNAAVILNITGVNTFADTMYVTSLAAGANVLLTFDTVSFTVLGNNTVTVTIPNDDNNTNNSGTRICETNSNAFTYAQGPTPDGGVGFTGATGDFVAKFKINSPQLLNQVNVNFAAGGQPFQIGIWDATGVAGAPGTNLFTSTTMTSTPGVFTVLVNPGLLVPAGDFYVGVRQTGTVNVSFAYQGESPIREQTFFYTSPTGGTTWTDFAPGSPFRFMIEPRFALANDMGVDMILNYTSGASVVVNQAITLETEVVNYGSATQTNIPVYYTVNGGAPVGPLNTSTLALNDLDTLNFSFTPATAGTYTLKFYTQLTGDQNEANDTTTLVLEAVQPITSFPYAENFDAATGYLLNGTGSIWALDSATQSNGIWGRAAVADFYNATAGINQMLMTPSLDLTADTNYYLSFDVAYRTYTNQNDSLQVWVSSNGGGQFTAGNPPLYRKSFSSNPSLSTATPSTTAFVPSATNQWRREYIKLSQVDGAGFNNVKIGFNAFSQSGNNAWVDNVQVRNIVLPTVTTAGTTSISANNAVAGGDVTSEGGGEVFIKGICFATTSGPTTANLITNNGSGAGAFTSTMNGLQPSTTYYYRAFATNAAGTTYGPEISFTTTCIAPIPTIAANGPLTICDGDSVVLTSSSTIGNTWNNNETTESITVTTAGTYNVTFADPNGCSATSTDVTVVVNPIPAAPSITANATNFCVGDTAILTASTAIGLTWSNGSSAITLSTTNNGSYYAIITENGCISDTSNQISVVFNPNPPTPSINYTDSILSTDAIVGVQWFLNGTAVTGATSSNYQPQANGTYSVSTTYGTGCSTASGEVTVSNVAIFELANNQFVKIYPNPSSGFITIEASAGIQFIKVFELNGRLVKQSTVGGLTAQVDLSELASGTYLIQLQSNNEIINHKMILQH